MINLKWLQCLGDIELRPCALHVEDILFDEVL